jgi:hypothetical protein
MSETIRTNTRSQQQVRAYNQYQAHLEILQDPI